MSPENRLHGTVRAELSQALIREAEPNYEPSLAMSITRDTVVRGKFDGRGGGDWDYFKFQGQTGDRVFAAALTTWEDEASLYILAPDGGTDLEADAGGGWRFGSSIAGLELGGSGTHYVAVNTLFGAHYDLYLRAQSGTPAAEGEPNDSEATALALPASGWITGATDSGSDVDYFKLALNAGDTVFASLDLNPERGPYAWRGTLSMGPFGGEYLNFPGNDSDDNPSETLYMTVKAAGTYYLRVESAEGGSGAYQLSVSVHPASAPTPTCTTYSSADVPVTLPQGTGAASAVIHVPGHPRIADLDVSLALSHDTPWDLDVHLRSPAGNDNVLINTSSVRGVVLGTEASKTWDLTLDDEAASLVGDFDVRNGLILRPQYDTRLEWFDGEDAGGDWTLGLEGADGNGGTLSDFKLTICEPPPAVSCPNGATLAPLLSADFESGDGGFTHSGTKDKWERGTPSYAPISDCNSGTQCWKTDLDATPDGDAGELKSAPIDLSSASSPIILSWAMKYQLGQSDVANFRIQEVGGDAWRDVWRHQGIAMGDKTVGAEERILREESAGWGVHTEDISEFAGKTVELVFSLHGSTAAAGLAIDDVSVSTCSLCGDCGDQNDCTADVCSSDATCVHIPLAAGTACSAGTCQAGVCVPTSSGGAGAGGASGDAGAPGTGDNTETSTGGAGGTAGIDDSAGAGGIAPPQANGGAAGDGGASGASNSTGEEAQSGGGDAGAEPSHGTTGTSASSGRGGGGNTGGVTSAAAGESNDGEPELEEGGTSGSSDDDGTVSTGGHADSAGRSSTAGTSGRPATLKPLQPEQEDEGCGCSTPGRRKDSGFALAGAMALCGVLVARRRRASRIAPR